MDTFENEQQPGFELDCHRYATQRSFEGVGRYQAPTLTLSRDERMRMLDPE
jgi:hypothetical protein